MENTVLDYVLATPPQQQQKNMKALVSVSVRPVNSGRYVGKKWRHFHPFREMDHLSGLPRLIVF